MRAVTTLAARYTGYMEPVSAERTVPLTFGNNSFLGSNYTYAETN